MRTNHPFHSTRTRWATALLVAAAALALTVDTHAAGQVINATITLDREHTSIVDRLPTGQGVNELRGDNPNASAVAYVHGTSGGKIAAEIGRNRNIALDGNTGGKVNAGRTAFLDLAGSFGCMSSVNVNFDGNPGCDPCVNTFPALPNSRFGALDADSFGFPDNFNLVIWGEDYDDLQIGCTVDTFARLTFSIAGQGWFMWWGPYFTGPSAGDTANPESPPIKVTRVSLSEWRFQTTGDHRAALYLAKNNGFEYHGQYTVKFSGTAVALPGQVLPAGNHCDIQARPGAPACTP